LGADDLDNELIRQIILAIKARKDATPQALEVDGADLIALLAIVRKLMITDMSATTAEQLLALAAATLALGGVYWLVRDQDRREEV
jgi:uncharacterized membrane protein (DUF373 family)